VVINACACIVVFPNVFTQVVTVNGGCIVSLHWELQDHSSDSDISHIGSCMGLCVLPRSEIACHHDGAVL
jgi:hypothetical protein